MLLHVICLHSALCSTISKVNASPVTIIFKLKTPLVICQGSAALGLDSLCGHGVVNLAAISSVLVNEYVHLAVSNAPKTKDMTLGPIFDLFFVLAPKCYFRFVHPWSLAGSAAFLVFYNLAVTKPD